MAVDLEFVVDWPRGYYVLLGLLYAQIVRCGDVCCRGMGAGRRPPPFR